MDGKEVDGDVLDVGNAKINVADFGSGLYFTKICVEGKCETRKWIKK